MTSPSNLVIVCFLALGGCATEQDPGAPAATEGDGGTSGVDSSGGAGESTGEPTTGQDEPETGSSSGADSQECVLADEGIEIPRLDILISDVSFGDVPCEVTGDGFMCTFEDGAELVDVGAVFDVFTEETPWQSGDSVLLSGYGPLASAYEARLSIEAEDETPLAVVVWNEDFVPEPFSVEVEDIGCVDPDSSVIPLEATYGFDGESVTLLGSASAQLGPYALFQQSAADSSEVSAGELGQAATFAFVLVP